MGQNVLTLYTICTNFASPQELCLHSITMSAHMSSKESVRTTTRQCSGPPRIGHSALLHLSLLSSVRGGVGLYGRNAFKTTSYVAAVARTRDQTAFSQKA